MTEDLKDIRKRLAEGLLYDMRQPLAAGALMDMERESKEKGSKLTGFGDWHATLKLALKLAGIQSSEVRGFVTPDGLKPERLDQLGYSQLLTLAQFAAPKKENGRGEVKSTVAKIFLNKFYCNVTPDLLAIAQQRAAVSATDKFVAFWRKHVEFLEQVAKDGRFPDARAFVGSLSNMA
ncbi:MAG: hypothetical protein K2Q01_03930, partial [Rickettsiales bacterium]|nr:hypothetical protein [Rickettsiales bacterium]